MRRLLILTSVVVVVAVFLGMSYQRDPSTEITSPDGSVRVQFSLKGGVPYYRVARKSSVVVENSRLGFVLKDLPSLDKNFNVTSSRKSSKDETWTQPWGEVKQIRNNYNQLNIALEEKSGLKRKLNLEFRVFNDGVGFRYEIPAQPNLTSFIIMDERTEFALNRDYSSWYIPAYGEDMDSEFLYRHAPLSKLNEKATTPITFESDSLVVSIHEAALVDYAGMALERKQGLTLKCDLYPWANGNRVEAVAPMKTPWRTIQVARRAKDLVSSYIELNLNEPNTLTDVSWIKPGKYNGIWWGMHLNRNTWEGGPNHGATTENVKAMIDFAAAHNLSGVLAEGWNQGWDGDWTIHGNFSFTEPYPDFDLAELSRYAKEKKVNLIAHHETGGNIANYERQLDDAFKLLQKYDIHYLKTGYVNRKPSGELHQGQFMVRHYQKVIEMGARYNVMIDMHEPVKDTGLRRTFPNMMTREGVRGTEYEAWSTGNPPSHTTILPFTRGLAGPIDYTPGIFDILFKNKSKFRVHTTLAKQLALYVVIYSPLHMAADLPENYENHPAFRFIEMVPTDWEFSYVVDGKIGEFVTTVRKDRNSTDWYLGSITNEEARTVDVKLDFLSPGKKYKAEIFQDGKDADVESNPLPIDILTKEVDASTSITISMATGGGVAIRFSELN
jgi:alpha-glucosidase